MVAPKLVEIAEKGSVDVKKALEEAKIQLLKNALWRAKKELNFKAAANLQTVLNEFGVVAVSKTKEIDTKKFPAKIKFALNKSNDKMLNDLVVGQCNRIGHLVSSDSNSSQNIYVYAFKKEDAKMLVEKVKDIPGVKLETISNNAKN